MYVSIAKYFPNESGIKSSGKIIEEISVCKIKDADNCCDKKTALSGVCF